jgi:hypothetical protein
MINFLKLIGDAFGESGAERRRRERHILTVFGVVSAIVISVALVLGPWKALGLIVVVLAIWGVSVRPELIVLLIALYTPFEPFLLKFSPDELYVFARYFPEVMVYGVLAVAFMRTRSRRQSISTPIDLPFLFFLVVALTSLLLNTVPLVNGMLGIRQIIRFILLFFAVSYLNPSGSQIRLFLKVMFGIVIFQGLLGLIQSFVGGPLDELLIPSEQKFFESIQLTTGTAQTWSPGTRVFATMGRYDQLGTFLCFFMLLAVGLLYKLKDKLMRRQLWLVLGLVAPAFMLTLSRASWFGFALGILVISAVLMRDQRVRLAFIAFAFAVIAYAAYSGLAVRYLTDYPEQTVVERFFEAFSYERWRGEYYGFGRLFWMVQTVTVVVPSAPIFGVGPGQYGGGAAAALSNVRVYQELNLPFGVFGTEGYIDNNWFSLWGETGTLGLIFYLWMLVSLGLMSLTVFRKSKKPFSSGLALGFIGCLFAVTLQAALGTYLEVRTLALFIWVIAAFVFVLGRREGLFGK